MRMWRMCTRDTYTCYLTRMCHTCMNNHTHCTPCLHMHYTCTAAPLLAPHAPHTHAPHAMPLLQIELGPAGPAAHPPCGVMHAGYTNLTNQLQLCGGHYETTTRWMNFGTQYVNSCQIRLGWARG